MSHEARWGAEPIGLSARDLPALKASFLLRHAPAKGRLLELGCGEGKVLRTLARERPGLTLLGCDVRDVPPADRAFEFRRMHEDIPAKDGELDAVVFNDVLEHVADPVAMLRELRRVIRPGGMLVGFVPLEGQPGSAYGFYRALLGSDLYRDTKRHLHAFERSQVRELLAAFDVFEERYAYHLLGQWL